MTVIAMRRIISPWPVILKMTLCIAKLVNNSKYN